MVRLVLICILSVSCFSGHGQELQEHILWDKNHRLSWSHFKGEVAPAAVPAAATSSGISYTYSANLLHHEVKLDFEVNAYFYPNESWYKPEFCTDLTLSHEQLHFDIAELFARKMRIKLRHTTFTKNVKSEVRKIYEETIKELSDFQERYDWETNFSRNTEAQVRWQSRIREALEKTDS